MNGYNELEVDSVLLEPSLREAQVDPYRNLDPRSPWRSGWASGLLNASTLPSAPVRSPTFWKLTRAEPLTSP